MLSGDKLYDKPPKKMNRPEENPYTGLGAVSDQPVMFSRTCDTPEVNLGVENGGYSNGRNSSIYAELEEVAVRTSGLLAVACMSVSSCIGLCWRLGM